MNATRNLHQQHPLPDGDERRRLNARNPPQQHSLPDKVCNWFWLHLSTVSCRHVCTSCGIDMTVELEVAGVDSF